MALKQYFAAFVFGLIGIFAFAPFSIKPLILVSYAYLIRSILFENNYTFKKLISWAIGHWGFGMSWTYIPSHVKTKLKVIETENMAENACLGVF